MLLYTRLQLGRNRTKHELIIQKLLMEELYLSRSPAFEYMVLLIGIVTSLDNTHVRNTVNIVRK